jgi:hypothetical protein
MGALLNFLVMVPHGVQVASEMQVDIAVGHASGAHPSTDMPHALTDLCLARLTSEVAWLHGYFTDSETRALGEGLV